MAAAEGRHSGPETPRVLDLLKKTRTKYCSATREFQEGAKHNNTTTNTCASLGRRLKSFCSIDGSRNWMRSQRRTPSRSVSARILISESLRVALIVKLGEEQKYFFAWIIRSQKNLELRKTCDPLELFCSESAMPHTRAKGRQVEPFSHFETYWTLFKAKVL